MEKLISLYESFIVFLDKLWKHRLDVAGIIIALLVCLGLLFFILTKTKKWNAFRSKCSNVWNGICKHRQGILNGVFVIFLLAGCAFSFTVLLSYRDLSLKNIQGINYFEQQENLYDESGCENYFYDYDGQQIEAQNGSVMSNWIACSAGQSITRNGIPTNVVCYFDKDKNFIERVDSYGLATITVPNNKEIAYVRIAVQPSQDRKIVYGDVISDDSVNGDYYKIPELKITERNFIKDFTVIESPDGKQWKITVDNEGNLSAEDVTGVLSASQLPSDFPEYTITGKSTQNEDYLLAMRATSADGYQYIFSMTATGDIKWYKKVPVGASNFRKIQYEDGTIRYAYMQVDPVDGECSVQQTNGGVAYTHIVLMDENFNVLNDNIRPLPYGSITSEDSHCESHDYKILGDNHYLLTSVTLSTVNNVPGLEGKDVKVVNAIIQEQKDGKVVMQWESIEHPELYEASVLNNDYEEYASASQTNYTDYVHINAIAVDPVSNDLLISCRSIGLMKLDRETGNILWIMGRGHNDINGLSEEQIGLYQHDVRYTEDGSFTIFDNSGGVDKTSRVCRYWIDENTLTLTKFEEFPTQYKSTSMGSAKLIDDNTDTYLISYGGGISDFAFEERNFSTNTVNMRFAFNDGRDLYRIFSGVEKTPTE